MEHPRTDIKIKRCAGGLRVSSSKQMKDGDSTDDQKNAISHFAEKINGQVIRWFEFVQSATVENLEDQPFQKVIDFCREHPGEIEYLLVSKIDRLTRGGATAYDYLTRQLAKYNVVILDAEGIIGHTEVNTLEHLNLNYTYKWALNNPTRENEIKEAENAKVEAQKICRRLIGAEIRYTQQGYWMRDAPYGLKSKDEMTPTGKRKILVPRDDIESDLLKLMFELAERRTLTDEEIVDELNNRGYKSRIHYKHDKQNPLHIIGHIGGIPLDTEQLRKYLSNTVYAGVICEKWTNNNPVKAAFDGIVSIEKFNKVNKGRKYIHVDQDGKISILLGLTAEWQITRMKENPDYAYKSYILCPVCNMPMLGSSSTGKAKKRYPAYHCSRGHKLYRIPKKDFEDTIREFINAIEFSDDFIDKLEETLREEWAKRQNNFTSKAIDINNQILAVDNEIKLNFDNFKSSSSVTIKKMCEEEIEKLQSKRLMLMVERDKKENDQLDMEKLMCHARYYMEHFPELLLGSENPLDNASFFGLVFQERPTYLNIVNGTPKLASLFKLNEDYKKSKSLMVTLRGTGLNRF